jgi:hypothetical protein
MKSLGNLVQMHLLEPFVSPHPCGDQLAKAAKDKGRHDTSPAHCTPAGLGRNSLHFLHLLHLLHLLNHLTNKVNTLLSHPLFMLVNPMPQLTRDHHMQNVHHNIKSIASLKKQEKICKLFITALSPLPQKRNKKRICNLFITALSPLPQ